MPVHTHQGVNTRRTLARDNIGLIKFPKTENDMYACCQTNHMSVCNGLLRQGCHHRVGVSLRLLIVFEFNPYLDGK